ncbi:unnamed protein product, partial [marine sediment metagenome]
MPELLVSAWLFVTGILRRFYYVLPALLLDPFDLYERHLYPRWGWELTMPDWYFPAAVSVGVLWAAILTFHELRTNRGTHGLRFEVREHGVDLPVYERSCPEQPFPLVQVTLEGRLTNNDTRKATVDGVGVQFLRKRGLLWLKVADASELVILGQLRARLDLKFHRVEVEGDSHSDYIREIWAYFRVPPKWNLEDLECGQYRAKIDMFP